MRRQLIWTKLLRMGTWRYRRIEILSEKLEATVHNDTMWRIRQWTWRVLRRKRLLTTRWRWQFWVWAMKRWERLHQRPKWNWQVRLKRQVDQVNDYSSWQKKKIWRRVRHQWKKNTMKNLAGYMEISMTKATVKKKRDNVDNFGLNNVIMKTTAIKRGRETDKYGSTLNGRKRLGTHLC